MGTTENLLTVAELAVRLSVPESFVRRMVLERRIAYVKVGRLLRFQPSVVETWLSGATTEPASSPTTAQWSVSWTRWTPSLPGSRVGREQTPASSQPVTPRRTFGNVQSKGGRFYPRFRDPTTRKFVNGPPTAKRADALRWLVQAEADLSRGVSRQDPRSLPLITAYARIWLEHRKLAPRTRELYEDLLDAFVDTYMDGIRIDQLTPAGCREWHHLVGTKTGPARQRQAYSLVRAIMTSAVRDDLLTRSPCSIVGAGSVKSPERPLLTYADVQRLADASEDWFQPIVWTTFWACLRLGEVLALRPSDIDLQAGTLRVERSITRLRSGPVEVEPKAGSRRTVYLPEPALDLLREHCSTPSFRVFTFKDYRELRRQHVQVAWHAARLVCDLPTAHFHDLRHSGLTLAAQMPGTTLKDVMHRAGHSTVAAAMFYQHRAADGGARVAELLSQYAAAQAQPLDTQSSASRQHYIDTGRVGPGDANHQADD